MQEVMVVASGFNTRTCDIAVVGGGILGLAIAALAAQRGYRVTLFRLSDRGVPRADTLRNQAWLQSGLIYVGHYGAEQDPARVKGRALAARMRAAGRDMVRELGLPALPDDLFGIYRVGDEEQARKLEADADALRLKDVRRLEGGFVRSRLGPVYEDGGLYYAIPDLPFPEAAVVRRLREWAMAERADLVQVEAPLRLVVSRASESGIECEWSGNRVRSKVTIAAAGAGNVALLNGLGIDPRMAIQQTPLLVVHDTMSISAPILADRFHGFSFVRHEREKDALPNGALVIGTKHARLVPYTIPDERVIDDDDVSRFSKHLPPALSGLIEKGRFTAGFEVIPPTELKLPYVAPWIQWYEQFPGLVMAMPGRATMGVAVARQLLGEIEERLGPPVPGSRSNGSGSPWDDGIYTHFHGYYDFNDWNRTQGGN